MSNLNLSLIFDVVNRSTAPLRKVTNDINRVSKTIRRLNRVRGLNAATSRLTKNLSGTSKELKKLTGLTLVGGGILGFGFKRQFLDTAAMFERFQTILETTEGSSEKAQASMSWIEDFAATTPFELETVTNAFVRLRAFGLDPTNGMLRTLGDTAAAMNVPIIQAVEAIADAGTGEFERLKELGIKARVQGNRVAFVFTGKDGEERVKVADKNSRKMIESTLLAIWNEKYAGNMDKMSSTWDGMTSNASDQWTQFAQKVMGSGLFDWMKGKLRNLLQQVDVLTKNGQLDVIAEKFGRNLQDAFMASWEIGKVLFSMLSGIAKAIKFVADLTGGYGSIVAAVAFILSAKLIVSLWGTAMALKSMATIALPAIIAGLKLMWAVMLANPIIFVAMAVAAAAILIIKNWSTVRQFWEDMVGHMTDLIEGFMNTLKLLFDLPGKLFDKVIDLIPDGVKDMAVNLVPNLKKIREALPLSQNQTGSGDQTNRATTLQGAGANQTEVGGTIKLEIDNGKARVVGVSTVNPDVDIDIDSGPMMAAF